MKWIALFSQTGSEIYNIAQNIGREPDIIITNNKDDKTWHPGVSELTSSMIIGKHKDLMSALMNMSSEDTIITLHGYLRIIPDKICDKFVVINGHPGDIVEYPELKGKDPQKKALELKLPSTGVVLHKAIAEVDAGEILLRAYHPIREGTDENQLITDLKHIQLTLWTLYLKDKL